MQAQSTSKKIPAISAVEIIVSVALFAAVILAVGNVIVASNAISPTVAGQLKATRLLDEATAAVESIRDESFSLLTPGVYGLDTTTPAWTFSGTSDTVDGFERSISITDVDTFTKQIEIDISWQPVVGNQRSISTSKLITDWQRTVPIVGGTTWAAPIQTGSANLAGNADAIDVAIEGNYAYTISLGSGGGKNATPPSFTVIDTSDLATIFDVATLDLTVDPVFIEVSGNYAYVSSTDNANELVIIDITNPLSPSILTNFNLPGNADANDFTIVDNTLYITRASSGSDELVAINITSKAAPSILGSINVGDSAFDVNIVGNYAYVATESNTEEIKIYDISNPASFNQVTSIDLTGTSDAYTLTSDSSYLLAVQVTGDISIYDVSSPVSPVFLGSYITGDAVFEMELSGYLVFLAVDSNNKEFLVLDITDPSTPLEFGNSNTNTIYGLDYDPIRDYVIGVGSQNNSEALIFEPS